MRSDVKLGLAIGGVLILVVIVFTIVNSGHRNQHGAELTGGTPQLATPADTSAGPIESNSNTAVNPLTDVPGASPATPATNVSSETAATSPAAPDTVRTGVAVGKSVNWEKLLATGQPDQDSRLVTESPMTPDEKLDNHPASDATKAPAVPDQGPMTTETPATGTPAATPAAVTPVPDQPVASSVSPADHPDADTIIRTAYNVTTQPSAQRTHVVRPGETYSSIAAAAYGNAKYYLAIAKANPGIDPTKLRPNTQIILPEIAEAKSAASPAQPTTAPSSETRAARNDAPVNSAKQYRVQAGDSLYKISEKLYGDAKHIDEIYQTNKDAIGPSPEKLKLGMVLKLVTAPTKL